MSKMEARSVCSRCGTLTPNSDVASTEDGKPICFGCCDGSTLPAEMSPHLDGEPVGLGAVIRDATGGMAIKVREGGHQAWAGDGGVTRWMSWSEFTPPIEVLSPGFPVATPISADRIVEPGKDVTYLVCREAGCPNHRPGTGHAHWAGAAS